ncbi:hypothetical protein GCM10025794_31340 [Massilia kyonggiensis]
MNVNWLNNEVYCHLNYIYAMIREIDLHSNNQIEKPPESNCLGSPAASNVPFGRTRMACAVL